MIAAAAQFDRCLILLIATFCAGCFCAPPVSAQDTEIESTDTQFWYQYSYQNLLSENWSVSVDSGYRNLWKSEDESEDVAWDRFHVSSDFSYRKNPRLNFDFGSGVYYTTRSALSDLAEVRTWQGATVYWPDSPGRVRRFVLTHRFRLEQRLTRQTGTSSWDLNSRARYKLSTAIAINRKELEPGAFYAYLGGEVFGDLSDDTSRVVTDRNRVSIGLGWLTTKKWTVEALYTYQQNRDTSGTGEFRLTDRIVELRVKTTLKILDRMKAH